MDVETLETLLSAEGWSLRPSPRGEGWLILWPPDDIVREAEQRGGLGALPKVRVQDGRVLWLALPSCEGSCPYHRVRGGSCPGTGCVKYPVPEKTLRWFRKDQDPWIFKPR